MASGTIKVSFDEMQKAVNSLNQQAQAVQKTTQTMITIVVQDTKSTWEGSAGNAYRNKFSQLQQDMNDFHHIILEYVSDLLQMLQNYRQAEQTIQSTVNPLETDVIQY